MNRRVILGLLCLALGAAVVLAGAALEKSGVGRNTSYEEGIPAGVLPGEIVAHKVGFLDGELNDAALVERGPHGPYVLAVCTEGGSWQLITDVAHAIDQFEAS